MVSPPPCSLSLRLRPAVVAHARVRVAPPIPLRLLRSPLASQVEDLICKFSKKGLTPSQIGVLLRDNHGVAQVSTVTGSKVLRILKGHGAPPSTTPRTPGRCAGVPGSLARAQAWRLRSRRTCTT